MKERLIMKKQLKLSFDTAKQYKKQKYYLNKTNDIYKDILMQDVKSLHLKRCGNKEIPMYGEMSNRLIYLYMQKNGENISKKLDEYGLESHTNKLGGILIIKGTRIPLSLIMHCLSEGITIQNICEDYDLKEEQVSQSIKFVSDTLDMISIDFDLHTSFKNIEEENNKKQKMIEDIEKQIFEDTGDF